MHGDTITNKSQQREEIRNPYSRFQECGGPCGVRSFNGEEPFIIYFNLSNLFRYYYEANDVGDTLSLFMAAQHFIRCFVLVFFFALVLFAAKSTGSKNIAQPHYSPTQRSINTWGLRKAERQFCLSMRLWGLAVDPMMTNCVVPTPPPMSSGVA